MRNAINISKIPTIPKKYLKNITDAPDSDAKIAAENDSADAPNTADDDAGSTESKNSHIH